MKTFLVVLLLLVAAPSLAQPVWLAAATDAAQAELSGEHGYSGPVVLTGPAETPFNPALPGLSGYYTAAVAGTDWRAWGVLDAGSAVVVSGLARTGDPADAVPLFATELAKYWTGLSGPDFFSLTYNYLHPKQQSGELSLEIRLSLLRGILDLQRDDPSRYPGSSTDLSVPFTVILPSPDLAAARVQGLVGRVIAEWSLAPSAHSLQMVLNYTQIYSALYQRAHEDPAAIPLLSSLVAAVTAQDRSAHPQFGTLLQLVADHHLFQLQIWTGPPLTGLDAGAVYGMLHAWRQVNDPATVTHSLQEVTRVAQRLPFFLPLEATAERGWCDGLALEGLTAAVRGAVGGNLGTALFPIDLATAGFRQGDVRWFNGLDEGLRSSFLQGLLDRYAENPVPALQQPALRFLAWLRAAGAVPPAVDTAVRSLLERELPPRVAALVAVPIPDGPFDPGLDMEIVTVAEVARAVGREVELDPFLDRFVVPFPGSPYMPAETPGQVEARRELLRGVWHRHGCLLLDQAHRTSRDPELLRGLDRFLAAAGPQFQQAWTVFHFQSSSIGGGYAGESVIYIFDTVPIGSATPYDASYSRLIWPEIYMHEAGHLLHDRVPPGFAVEWARLWERSHALPFDPDLYPSDHLSGYASSETNEDAAETLRTWVRDNRGFLRRSVQLAREQGKWLPLEKYLLWADVFSQLPQGHGDGTYPMFEAVATQRGLAEGENHLGFRQVGEMRVLQRDAYGRILRMSDSIREYAFTWSGRNLAGVAVSPEWGFHTVAPCRLVDTRQPGQGPALSGGPRPLSFAGACGLPATAVALSVNVTVVQPVGAGHLILHPADSVSPATSSINFAAGRTRANNSILAVSADGTLSLSAFAAVAGGGSVHLILDVNGYFD